eukprot:TRINITY_DN86102_c0_g1_i1.p1 TRINITY_DN86102_c0_g1~~TRINITY_DN86102_c0_g1_i1.p1  ORF type:complete len:160 (-),score=17.66 TRINITY_DN86102_c0_g1_i1:52-504(-)
MASHSHGMRGRPRKQPIALPVAPMEVDFISGPHRGERLLITDRVCTIGRSESSTVQLADPALANVSRTHCIFECVGDRWQITDNKSTNGTWRRLSCDLTPSEPKTLTKGMTFLAGVTELQVEEADLTRWWIPSVASVTLREFCDGEEMQS